jgi:cytochrome c553
LTLGVACQREGEPQAGARVDPKTEAASTKAVEAEVVEAEVVEPVSPLAPVMANHFAHAALIEQAVIDGDLDGVKLNAQWLVDELPKQSMPEAWQPQLARMQAAAGEAAKSQTLVEAGAAVGRVLETCGACHLATGKGPSLPEPTPVPVGDDTTNRMLRHQWAAARMREAMISGSDERWNLGAGAVSVAPPEPCPIPDAEILDDETLALREKIYELGAKALKTSSASDRAVLYGEYLTTCASCHTGGC